MVLRYVKAMRMPSWHLVLCGLSLLVAFVVIAVILKQAMTQPSPNVIYIIDINNIGQFIDSISNGSISARGLHDVYVAIVDQRYRVEFEGDVFVNDDWWTRSVVITTGEMSIERAVALYESLEQVVINSPGRVMKPQGLEDYRNVVIDRNDNVRHSLSIAKYPVRIIYQISQMKE